MSDPDAPPLDEARIVEVLDRHQVDYVLVGGMGGRLHGATKLTRDFDVCPETGRENLGRLADALKELGAKMRGLPDDLQPPVDAGLLGRMEIGTWRTAAGDLDVLLGIPSGTMANLRRYPELHSQAAVASLAGRPIYVATLEHIIASKEAANRPSDLEALPELRALRAAELAGQATEPESSSPPAASNTD